VPISVIHTVQVTDSPPQILQAASLKAEPVLIQKYVSRRDFKIHIQNAKRLKIVSAIVYIDKQGPRTLKRKALTTILDLQGLPKGTVMVKILAWTQTERRLTGTRIYHTCTKTTGAQALDCVRTSKVTP
jgi:hypothetical protein